MSLLSLEVWTDSISVNKSYMTYIVPYLPSHSFILWTCFLIYSSWVILSLFWSLNTPGRVPTLELLYLLFPCLVCSSHMAKVYCDFKFKITVIRALKFGLKCDWIGPILYSLREPYLIHMSLFLIWLGTYGSSDHLWEIVNHMEVNIKRKQVLGMVLWEE
jgi:hypothetical protein